MSFDFSAVPTKEQFVIANPSPPPPVQPTAEQIYSNRKQQVCDRICGFLTQTNCSQQEMTVRVGFLTTEDKAALFAALEAKGYICTETNGLMKIH